MSKLNILLKYLRTGYISSGKNSELKYFTDPILLTYPEKTRRLIADTGDPVRYGTIYLAIDDILKNKISGSFAECGVFKGDTSKFIHELAPDRKLYLFDTFVGFSINDLDNTIDDRFKDTSVDLVLKKLNHSNRIIIKKGFFPDTTLNMDDDIFAFIMLDFDKYNPTLAALEYFYPKVSKGGYVFLHDYNSPESDYACSKALNLFLSDKPEMPLAIPDCWGSVFFRKI